MINKIMTVFFSLTIITGCSNPGARPDEVGFIGAAGNINSGEFDRQLKRKKLKLVDSEGKVQSETRQRALLQQALDKNRVEKQKLDKELSQLRNSNNNLEQIITTRTAENRQQTIKKNQLLDTLYSLKRRVAAVEKKKPSKPNPHYQAQIDQLKKEIALLQKAAIAK